MTDAQIIADLRARLERAVAEDRFSGAVLVAKNGKILFEHAYGFADHAFNVPNKVDTKFNLGSMGKMFTAVSILQLAEQGKLSLNDTLIKVVEDYPDRDIASKITIHQLLTHTSGLGDMFNEKFRDTPKDTFTTIPAHLPLFTGKPLLFDPGTKWSYSNAGFIVLGLVIERVSGESYYDYVREHIFKPAGMINTDNYKIDADVPNLALGYTTGGPAAAPGTPRRTNIYFLQRGASAGGGYSTVEDLLRFAGALEGHKLLNKEYTDLDMIGKVATGRGDVKYAYGMEEQFLNGVRIVGHGGGGPGINSNLDMYPDLGYTVAVMSNYDGAAQLLNERLRLELTGQELPQAVHLSPEVLKTFAGKYQPVSPPNAPSGMGMPPMEITIDQEGLWINTGMGGKHRFLPLSPMEFYDEDSPGARLTFINDEKGQITSLTLTGVGPRPVKATKLP
jgi:CubicO group peptidase (beta-lactamase class C family)